MELTLKRTAELPSSRSLSGREGRRPIRQNKVFKDFYFLAEEKTSIRRELCVVGAETPLKFFRSRRRISGILDSNAKLGAHFQSRHGDRFKVVCEYYRENKDKVEIKDIAGLLPVFRGETGGVRCPQIQ